MQNLSQPNSAGAFGRIMAQIQAKRVVSGANPGAQATLDALTGKPSGGLPAAEKQPADPAVLGTTPDQAWQPAPEETGD
jgi:hypothetical protein